MIATCPRHGVYRYDSEADGPLPTPPCPICVRVRERRAAARVEAERDAALAALRGLLAVIDRAQVLNLHRSECPAYRSAGPTVVCNCGAADAVRAARAAAKEPT